MGNEIIVSIRNWGKFNPRKDVKHTSWFRLDHKFLTDPDFFNFSHEEKLIWIYVLCLASQNNTGSATVNGDFFHRVHGIDFDSIYRTVQKLQQLKMVTIRTVRGRYADVRKRALRNGTERNERYDTDEEEGEKSTVSSTPIAPLLHTASPPKPNGFGHKVQFLIGVYVSSWQQRYKTKEARPDVGGKARGILQRLLKDHKPDHIADLLQVYCQHKDRWFETKRHDLATFEQSYNKIALDFVKGTDDGTDWDAIFGNTNWRKKNDRASLPQPNEPDQSYLREECLP